MAKGFDIEAGRQYPTQTEDPKLRWGFIRKVYSIVALQLLMTVAIASVVVFVPPVFNFFHTETGLIVYLVTVIVTFIILIIMQFYIDRHPLNMILLGLFTSGFSLTIGIACSFAKGRIILEASFLTAIVVVSLTLFTFWAAKRGHDFNFLWPFLFCALILAMIFSIIQVLIPLGDTTRMIFSFFVALLYCGFIIYDTDNLIKRFNYDEYAIAAATLYLDILNLFLALLSILGIIDD